MDRTQAAVRAFDAIMNDEQLAAYLNAKADEATGRSPTPEQKESDEQWWDARREIAKDLIEDVSILNAEPCLSA